MSDVGLLPTPPPPGLGMPLAPTPCDGGKEGSQAPIAVEGSAGHWHHTLAN